MHFLDTATFALFLPINACSPLSNDHIVSTLTVFHEARSLTANNVTAPFIPYSALSADHKEWVAGATAKLYNRRLEAGLKFFCRK